MTREVRNFDVGTVGSITTGIMMAPSFSLVHEAMEFILGHPVWTHEIPSMRDACVDLILERYPNLPTAEPEDYRVCLAKMGELYPYGISMPKGEHKRTAGPVETLIGIVGR